MGVGFIEPGVAKQHLVEHFVSNLLKFLVDVKKIARKIDLF